MCFCTSMLRCCVPILDLAVLMAQMKWAGKSGRRDVLGMRDLTKAGQRHSDYLHSKVHKRTGSMLRCRHLSDEIERVGVKFRLA